MKSISEFIEGSRPANEATEKLIEATRERHTTSKASN